MNIVYRHLLLIQGSYSDWKTWKMGRHFPVGEKSENFVILEKWEPCNREK